MELPETNARIIGGIERHLDRSGLVAASETLTAATTALREAGFAPGRTQDVDFGAGSIPVSRFDLQLSSDGLVLGVEVPATTVDWQGGYGEERSEAGCSGSMAIGPGVFRLGVDFATDKLGRIQTIPGERALWDGPLTVRTTETASGRCPGLDSAGFADVLTRRIGGWVGGDIATTMTRVLGFALAAPLGQPRNTDGRTFRAHLRARNENPVVRRDDGISASFELQLQSDVAGCLAPYAFATGRAQETATGDVSPTPAGSALMVPTSAIGALIEAWVLHGGLCGRFAAADDVLLSIATIPAWFHALDDNTLDDVEFELQPYGPPLVSAADGDRLVWRQSAVDIEIHGRWGGARWRLGTMTVAVDVALGFSVGPDGWVVGDAEAVEVEVLGLKPGLLPTIDGEDAQRLVTLLAADLTSNHGWFRTPGAIAPATTRVVAFVNEGRTARIAND